MECSCVFLMVRHAYAVSRQLRDGSAQDPWWTQSIEAQAIDRTYRLGQTRDVRVFQLISEGTSASAVPSSSVLSLRLTVPAQSNSASLRFRNANRISSLPLSPALAAPSRSERRSNLDSATSSKLSVWVATRPRQLPLPLRHSSSHVHHSHFSLQSMYTSRRYPITICIDSLSTSSIESSSDFGDQSVLVRRLATLLASLIRQAWRRRSRGRCVGNRRG